MHFCLINLDHLDTYQSRIMPSLLLLLFFFCTESVPSSITIIHTLLPYWCFLVWKPYADRHLGMPEKKTFLVLKQSALQISLEICTKIKPLTLEIIGLIKEIKVPHQKHFLLLD